MPWMRPSATRTAAWPAPAAVFMFGLSDSYLNCFAVVGVRLKSPNRKHKNTWSSLDPLCHRFGDTLNDTFERRLTSLFQPYELDFQQAILLDRCWAVLKKCRVADAVKIIKTWSNGWATSSRYHEGLVLPCLFGCNSCSDSLEHYLHCTHLLAMWRFLAGNVSADPLKRWGLIAPELNDFLRIACVFSGYHAVRMELKRISYFFYTNQTSLTGSQIRVAWTVFASAFHVEACEVCVPCRHFSVANFLNCLQHNSEFASYTIEPRPDVT